MNQNIREYYMSKHPDDELGQQICEWITFGQFIGGMMIGNCPYEMLEVSDSLVRERVFEGCAEVLVVPYHVIFRMWMDKDELTVKYVEDNLPYQLGTLDTF